MPLNKSNTKAIHRRLYAGKMTTVILFKRGIDQSQGTVKTITLYQCYMSAIHKTGEPLQDDMTSSHRCVWRIPRTEMDRVGLTDINAADRIYNANPRSPAQTRWWQPESTTLIDIAIFENFLAIACVRIDPPK